jgi:uncharacterized protein (DUF2062 family)/trans-aconitate methyltransferase
MARPEAAPAAAPGRWDQLRHRLRELLYRLRVEGGTPGQQAAAVALGIFIGCTPLYGLHLPLCIIFARLLGLNRLKTYIAAHISTPVLLPFLLFAEIQVGRLLRGAQPLSIRPGQMKQDFDFWHWRAWGGDLLVGSVVLGAALAALFGLITLLLLWRGRRPPEVEALIEQTAHRYIEAGLLHTEFVRGKLRHDPLYFWLLHSGLLPARGLLLDLGCGRGILLSLLVTAGEQAARGEYPKTWPPPPCPALRAIEGRSKIAQVARQALGNHATVESADLRGAELPAASGILLFDVLHYLPPPDQERLLARIAAALEPGALLLVREADADAGWRFHAVRFTERLSALLRALFRRGPWPQPLHYRSARAWHHLLVSLGFDVEREDMGMGTPYANVLLRAVRREAESIKTGGAPTSDRESP